MAPVWGRLMPDRITPRPLRAQLISIGVAAHRSLLVNTYISLPLDTYTTYR
jgi:hypothetical protein